MCQQTVNLGIERGRYSSTENSRGVIPTLKKGAFVSGKPPGDPNEAPTLKWPKNPRWAKIADGAPKLDARQIPGWVQSPSALERAWLHASSV